MVTRGDTEGVMPGSLDTEVRISLRTIRFKSFVAMSAWVCQSSRHQLIGLPNGPSLTFRMSRLWTQRYWPTGRIVLQLCAALAMTARHEAMPLSLS
jgi:hypothetical protein